MDAVELIYIGAEYKRGLVYDDGSTFSVKPAVTLYNVSYKKYYKAEVTLRAGNTGCDFVFDAALTKTMIQGAYALEIYEDDTMTKMLKRVEYYAKAIEVTASQITNENR